MLTINYDKEVDAILIQFESGPIGYAEELDEDRIVDYSLNPGRPIGVCLHNVSLGVKLNGLPHPNLIQGILGGLEVNTV